MSFLVDHRLVQLETDLGPYKKGAFWAEPDLDHAAELMRHVFENRTAATRIAMRGKEHVFEKLHPQSIGALMEDRLSVIRSTKLTSSSQKQPRIASLLARLSKG